MPLKGSLSRSPAFSVDPSPLRIPLEAPALDPFPGLSPQCTSLDSLLRSHTRSLWEPEGSLHHQHFRSPDSQACPPPPAPGGPLGESRGPYPPLLPAASFPFHSSDRYPAPTHQPVPTWGPCTGGRGGVEKRRKTSPSPTLGWKNQRGSIPEE